MAAIVRITKVFESASTGLPVPTGSLNVYLRGTTSPVTLYTDSTGGTTSPNPTPIVNGVVSPFVLEGSYDLVPVVGGNTYPAIPFEAVSGSDEFALVTKFKTQRTTTGSIALSTTSTVSVTWATAFADTNYSVSAVVQDASHSLQVVDIDSVTTTGAVIVVKNADGAAAHTGTLHLIAIHD